jgi:hypothetical protein
MQFDRNFKYFALCKSCCDTSYHRSSGTSCYVVSATFSSVTLVLAHEPPFKSGSAETLHREITQAALRLTLRCALHMAPHQFIRPCIPQERQIPNASPFVQPNNKSTASRLLRPFV